jgi:hypothetical protein
MGNCKSDWFQYSIPPSLHSPRMPPFLECSMFDVRCSLVGGSQYLSITSARFEAGGTGYQPVPGGNPPPGPNPAGPTPYFQVAANNPTPFFVGLVARRHGQVARATLSKTEMRPSLVQKPEWSCTVAVSCDDWPASEHSSACQSASFGGWLAQVLIPVAPAVFFLSIAS